MFKKAPSLVFACLFLLPIAYSQPTTTPPPAQESASGPKPEPASRNKETAPPVLFTDLKNEKERLELENSVAEAKLRQQLSVLKEKTQSLQAENDLAWAESKKNTRLSAIEQQAEIDRLKLATELINQKIAVAQAERNASNAAELAALKQKTQSLQAENELALAESNKRTQFIQLANQENQLKQQQLQVELQTLQVGLQTLQTERTKLDIETARLNSQLELRDKRDRLRNLVSREIIYTKNPYQDGVLTVSDRRIPLNGVITQRTADYIQERIDYFNNQNPEYPIFIVIDGSPGGSVMAGYKILKAMEGSSAPVYTVVKSYAASMAAAITSLSSQSFAYPNAIIIHHQILGYSFGNLTEQRENVKDLQDWWRRLAAPIAKKMGVSLDEFIKQMYDNRSTGDWQVFGDRAKELKWVDQIVQTIREESLDRNPDTVVSSDRFKAEAEQVDDTGRAYQSLPRLNPLDRYYLYNPDGYYRLGR